MPLHTTKRRTTTNLKTKTQQELTENQTVWKSNNQGIKEETFIQTGRRGRDGQLGWKGLTARQQLEDGVGEAVAGRPGEVAAGGAGGPTLTCG